VIDGHGRHAERDRQRPHAQRVETVGGDEDERGVDDLVEGERGIASGSHRRYIERPPSTVTEVPVTCAARSSRKKRTANAISSGRARRPSGVLRTIASTNASSVPDVIDVSAVGPGITRLTVVPERASSRASVLVRPTSP